MDGKFWFKALLTGLLLTTLVMAGCEGDDGDDGTAGASAYEIAVENGFTGTEQEWLDSLATAGGGVAEPVETCIICHGENAFADAEEAHAIDRNISYTVVTPPTADGDDLVVAFDIRVNGAPYDLLTAVQRTVIFQGVNDVYTRNQFANNSNAFLESVANGVYTFRIPGGALLNGAPVTPSDFVGTDARVYFRLNTPAGVTPARRASVSADDAAYARLDLASDQACINCHGNFAGGLTSHHYNPFEVSNCIACHSAVNPPGDFSSAFLFHGIHNSHNMPTGEFVSDAGTFSVTYPTYTTNCSVCHDSDAALAVANAMAVSGDNCFSCHGDMTSWDFAAAGVGFHSAYNGTEDCQACHVPDGTGIARATVAEFHNGLTTERAGLIWDGRDASVTEGARIDHQITGVTRTGDSLAITWQATIDGIAVNPCNTTATVDAPTFTSGYSVLKAFFQGGDLVNADNGNSSPGQANSTNLDFTAGTGNTVCAGNVATTTITLTPAEAALTGDARVALQGKPNIFLAEPSAALGTTIPVRSKTPTFDFALATGAAAGERRSIADSESCLKCHVGSLYQHGGNRVDNVELCVMCHNEASSEQNVREGMGVVASEAYDGKAGQTYGFKSMLHAIHSSGETGAPIVIYRNRGIYAWADDETKLANWPGTGSQIVFGSDNVTQNHNFHAPTYPRALNDCAACHTADFSMLPDQSVAVATTINAGSAPFDNQLDDVLEGASAAACMSCHQSGVSFEQKALKAHAYQNGWTPQTFEEGRQTIIDAAK